MIDIEKWMKEVLEKLKNRFGEQLLFVGLQGSYARGEMTGESDIDIVVVLNTLSIANLQLYREIIQRMDHSEKACGFIGGREELSHWPKTDLLQFEMETIPWHGSLAGILPPLSASDIRDGIRLGASALYHAACHTYIHAGEPDKQTALKGYYKAAFFIVQSLHRLETGRYIKRKDEILPELDGTRRKILTVCLEQKFSVPSTIDDLFGLLIGWSGEILKTV